MKRVSKVSGFNSQYWGKNVERLSRILDPGSHHRLAAKHGKVSELQGLPPHGHSISIKKLKRNFRRHGASTTGQGRRRTVRGRGPHQHRPRRAWHQHPQNPKPLGPEPTALAGTLPRAQSGTQAKDISKGVQVVRSFKKILTLPEVKSKNRSNSKDQNGPQLVNSDARTRKPWRLLQNSQPSFMPLSGKGQ